MCSTIFQKDFKVQAGREGVSLGPKDRKNECVVSGGLGTMAVQHKGETYYVCCSGCRDLFQENPEAVLAEAAEREKAKEKN